METKIVICYRNYKNEIKFYTIIPSRLFFGKTEYYPEEQWLLDAYVFEKDANRTFALKNIIQWGV